MNQDNLRELLAQPYQFENWKKVVNFVFPNVSYLQSPVTIPSDEELVESFRQVGSVQLNDGKNLALFEVHVKPHVNIVRKRVALRNLVAKYIDQDRNHGVLAIYEKGTDDYRFTYTARETDYDELKGVFVQKETEAKRFTYVLGANETCRTARDRFWELSQHKEEVTIKDVENAFSVEKLSKEFFAKYKIQYLAFVDYLCNSILKISSFNANEKRIRDFVKKMLGRIVFLHFVQKKGWLGASNSAYEDGDKQFMYKLWQNSKKDTGFYQLVLAPLFFDALNQNHRPDDAFTFPDKSILRIPYLGGGLFEKDSEDPDWLTFPPALFENLFSFFHEYNFTIDENDPHENEVGIDPEMLGQIFENLLEDNKDKGAFYTPKPIVKYMCQESLVQYLLSSFEKEGIVTDDSEKQDFEEKLGLLVKKYEAGEVIQYDRILAEALYNVKICDPAIGSGAFPMGILNEMVMLINVLHNASPDVVEVLWKMNDWQAATVKKHIIQNSIYGVDIEKGAVDIARLRFWLSLIIDEEKPSNLPSLDYKIVVGNSLISKFEEEVIDIDWEVKEEATQGSLFGDDNEKIRQRLLKTISQEQVAFYVAENHQKEKLSLKIRNLKIDLLINQLRLMIKSSGILETPIVGNFKDKKKFLSATYLYTETQGWKKTICNLELLKRHAEKPFNHFDWKLDFPEVLNPDIVGENVGFDIVIGNPPYIALQRMNIQSKIGLSSDSYKTFENTGDIYSLFYEKGQQLLKFKGILTFITSRQWMQASYGKSLRKFLANETNPIQLIDFGQAKIFDGATVFVNILFFEKAKNNNGLMACLFPTGYDIEHGNLSTFFTLNKQEIKKLTESTWAVSNAQHINTQIENIGKPLDKWQKIEFFRGITSGFNEAFHISESIKEVLISQDPKNAGIIKPLLRGKDIKRYGYDIANLFTLFIPWHFPLQNDNSISKSSEKAELEFQNQYPAIYNHLLQFKDELSNRNQSETGIRYEWYALQRFGADFWENFEKPKIVWIEISDRANYAYDDKGMYLTNSAYFLTCNDKEVSLKYLLAILNSTVSDFYFSQKTARIAGGRMRYTSQYVGQIRVPKIKISEQKPFITLVDIILFLKKQLLKDSSDKVMVFFFEQVIDVAVAELYFKEQIDILGFDILKYLQDLPSSEDSLSLDTIRKIFSEFNVPEHPIRKAVSLLKNYEPFKTIEETLNRKN
ncbi:MAG TPA: TaqI-like C-terminal specificity domain-containing protein [Prolixibacteraceae bacterium]|jgi:hypothetical protein